MKLFVWQHSKKFSSWSMFDEPHICKDNYLRAEVTVLAETAEEALDILGEDGFWNVEELRRLEPRIISLDRPAVISRFVSFG